MLVTNRNYNALLKIYTEEDKRLCDKLIQLFSDCKTDSINMGSVGNSIASGYSKCDEMIPLFARSHIYDYKYRMRFYTYARPRRNEEINVLKWYNSNLSHYDINRLLLLDIKEKEGQYAGFSDRQKGIYKTVMKETDIGFRDYVHLDDNIMVYNGLSGTFTDILRKGSYADWGKMLHCFRKDFEYLKVFLVQAWLDNPKLQIYVCGLPNAMEIGITNKFDRYIKKAVRMIPNAVYVKGVSRNFFSTLDGQKVMDYHYNKPEYLQLLCNVWESILNNYITLNYKNDILYELMKYNKQVEFEDTTSKGDSKLIKKLIIKCAEKYMDLLDKYNIDEQRIKREIWKFYNENYLQHFGCTDRKAVAEELCRKIL